MAEPEDRDGKLVATILKAGAVAAALSSIIALVVTLLPDSETPDPPPRIAGELSDVRVRSVASLAQYGRRARPVPEVCSELRRSLAGTSTATASFVSYVQAEPIQGPPADGGGADQDGAGQGDGTGPGDGAGPGTTTEQQAPTDTTPDPGTTTPGDGERPEPTGEPELETDARGKKLPFEDERQVAQALVPDAGFLQSIETSEPELMRRFIQTAPGVRNAADTPLSRVELKRLTAAIRGSVVAFRVRVQGRRDKCTVVRGTLVVFSNDPSRRAVEPDFRESKPFFFVAQADDHAAVADLFVPRLREGQPFQVELRLIDESGELDRQETTPFE